MAGYQFLSIFSDILSKLNTFKTFFMKQQGIKPGKDKRNQNVIQYFENTFVKYSIKSLQRIILCYSFSIVTLWYVFLKICFIHRFPSPYLVQRELKGNIKLAIEFCLLIPNKKIANCDVVFQNSSEYLCALLLL